MKAILPFAVLLLLTLGGTFGVGQPAKGGPEPLVDQVRKAIDAGVQYLKNAQNFPKGNWQDADVIASGNPGGQTALALLALLNAGVAVDDPHVKAGLNELRKIQDPLTYVRSLQTMVFVEAGQAADLERIKKNVDHLVKIAQMDGTKLQGWNYDRGGPSIVDNSNTQYALLALWVARQSGVSVKREFWDQVSEYYTRTRTQPGTGGWPYQTGGGGGAFAGGDSPTMTVAGICGLLMAQMELNRDKENVDPSPLDCGFYQENAALKGGMAWLWSPPPAGEDRVMVQPPKDTSRNPLSGRTFYNLYGIERLGRLSGQRFLGPHDWYREGCAWLVKMMKPNGSWSLSEANWDANPIISTSFAVLFLSKGRTPVLISKLAHGPVPRQNNDQDWNRRHNDLRHLVDFCSEHVFKKMPLAWQIFDMRRDPRITQDKLQDITSDLLQSPILYITGHDSLANRRLDPMEKARLKEYVDNGGFILGVACCGKKDFSDGFRELCEDLWPNSELVDLDLGHPVWNMRMEVKPGSFGLKGIQQGCKTVAILSPQDLCGWWENNRRVGEGDTAFRLGANIVAYATGLEPPKSRLTAIPVVVNSREDLLATPPRGYFQIGQIISKPGEKAAWKPAPEAMSKLAQNLRQVAGLDALVKTADVPIDSKDLVKFKFLYMHGRKEFKFAGEQLERLRFNLKNGGLLLADACCGKEAFDKSFREFITDLFPKEAFPGEPAPRLVQIEANDPLLGKELNGAALTDLNIECRTERGAPSKRMRPALEGVKIGNRWVVIYSKYDIGCALEKHQSADCIGYSYDSALLVGRAAVLYHFWLEPGK